MIEHWKNLSLENIHEEVDGVLCEEVWKSAFGYEDYFYISNMGRIKIKERMFSFGAKNMAVGKTDCKIRKQVVLKIGYLCIGFYKNKKRTVIYVHKMVANTFLENIYNKKTINHKNGIKTDNRVINIEYATQGENNLHAYRTKLRKGNGKPIVQLNKNNIFLNSFNSIQSARDYLNKPKGSVIGMALKNNKLTAYGYRWMYKSDYESFIAEGQPALVPETIFQIAVGL